MDSEFSGRDTVHEALNIRLIRYILAVRPALRLHPPGQDLFGSIIMLSKLWPMLPVHVEARWL
jgi:hypothetical protein